ncbi:hypothetical protein QZH41_000680 [Actinostola sp. cb2023]|nr:hypothetical protein QZH41_000680 [Actinostola sp. cb2023]
MVVLFLESASPDFIVTLESPISYPRWLILHSVSVPQTRILSEEGKIQTVVFGASEKDENEPKTHTIQPKAPLLTIPAGEYTLSSVQAAMKAAISLVYRNLQMHSAVNLFIANMAVSDILQAIFGIPRVITEVVCGRERWLIGGYLERFYAVVFPFKFSYLNKHSKIVIPGLWLTGTSLHAIYWKIFTLANDNNNQFPTCYQKWSSAKKAMIYYLVVFVGLFFLALATTIVMYTIIIVKIKQKKVSGETVSGLRRSRETQERKLLRVVIAITIVFFACFFPQTVLIIVAPLYVVPRCHAEALRLVAKVMEQTYSAVNPILCITFSANYRSGFVSALGATAPPPSCPCAVDGPDFSVLTSSSSGIKIHQTE